jgi:hypothetical protein
MGSHNFEQSNVVLMIYKQVVLVVGIILLFLFGIDTARTYILPKEWKGAASNSVNNAQNNNNSIR